MNKKNVSCKNINWQWFRRLARAWDVLWYDIVSVDQIAHGKCDCRTVILAIIFYRSLVSVSSVTGLGVYTRRWVYDNITPHSLCYLARVRLVHRICHKSSIFGLYTEYRYRNNAQMVLTGQYDDSERWQGTVIIENGYLYGKCRPPVVFSMEWTGAPLPTAGSGVPGVKYQNTPLMISQLWFK